jgi:hypothetical protein
MRDVLPGQDAGAPLKDGVVDAPGATGVIGRERVAWAVLLECPERGGDHPLVNVTPVKPAPELKRARLQQEI